MIKFAPQGYSEKTPTIKQIWKWLTQILNECIHLKQKKDNNNVHCVHSDIIQSLLTILHTDNEHDIILKLQSVIADNILYMNIIKEMYQYFQFN